MYTFYVLKINVQLFDGLASRWCANKYLYTHSRFRNQKSYKWMNVFVDEYLSINKTSDQLLDFKVIKFYELVCIMHDACNIQNLQLNHPLRGIWSIRASIRMDRKLYDALQKRWCKSRESIKDYVMYQWNETIFNSVVIIAKKHFKWLNSLEEMQSSHCK